MIQEGGDVSLKFSHASDYILVMTDETENGSESDMENQTVTGDEE